jgi:hypothetical protein
VVVWDEIFVQQWEWACQDEERTACEKGNPVRHDSRPALPLRRRFRPNGAKNLASSKDDPAGDNYLI